MELSAIFNSVTDTHSKKKKTWGGVQTFIVFGETGWGLSDDCQLYKLNETTADGEGQGGRGLRRDEGKKSENRGVG